VRDLGRQPTAISTALRLPRCATSRDGLLSLLRGKNVDILNTIRDTRDLGDDTAAKLKSVVEGYTKNICLISSPLPLGGRSTGEARRVGLSSYARVLPPRLSPAGGGGGRNRGAVS